jgi:cyclomaltodextrinase
MNIRSVLSVANCFVLLSLSASGEAAGGEPDIPGWARDARWYQVDVARFRNGDPSNDPAGTLPWSSEWPSAKGDTENLDARHYGGDLRGIESKLPYLQQLGINALYLSPILTDDLRHVEDSFGVRDSLSKVTGETVDPATRKLSASDKVLLGLLKEAHRRGLHVVLDGGPPRDSQLLFNAARLWLDPDGNGDPSDGVDGWVLHTTPKDDPDVWKRFRKHVKEINPKAILVAHPQGDAPKRLEGDTFDVAISYEAGKAFRRFLSAGDKAYGLEQFLLDLNMLSERHNLGTKVAILSAVSGPEIGRLLSGLGLPDASSVADSSSEDLTKAREAVLDRWRLATVLHHFYLGAPVTYYGDEVGMYGAAGPGARAPMWWYDPSSPADRPPEYRADFFDLIRLLNIRRELDVPMRHGDFRTVMIDEKRKVFAFGRTLGENEVILAVNYGDKKRQVKISAGWPGQMIALAAIQLKPPKGKTSLRIEGSRQQADGWGDVSIWINPMSIRIVVAGYFEER